MKDSYRLIVLGTLFALMIGQISWFFRRYRKEKRSLWLGVSFLAALFSVMIFAGAGLLVFESVPFIRTIMIIGVVSLGLGVLMFPFAFIAFMLVSGIQLVRREGFAISRLLSIGVAIFYLAYLIAWPLLYDIRGNSFFNFLYIWFSFCFYFTDLIFIMYTITNMLNLLRVRRKKYNYIIVLGAGLRKGREVTPLLAGRVDKGIEAHRQNPGSKLILSGGQGADEIVAEAVAMKHYALLQGVDEADILVEDKSVNTRENLLFSKQLVEENSGQVASNLLVVTNRYHVLRALLLAKNLKISCDGRGSRTKLYFSLNAFVREWIAYLVLWRKKYMVVLGGSFVVIGMFFLLLHYLNL